MSSALHTIGIENIVASLLPLQALGIPNFAALLILSILATSPFFCNTDNFKNFRKDIWKKIPLSAMPLFWLVIMAIGLRFAKGPLTRGNEGLQHVVAFIAVSFFIYGIYFLFKNRGLRSVTFFLLLINSYFVVMAFFISEMNLTGANL